MDNERIVTKSLAEILGLGECYYYDACPGPYGLLYNIDGYSEEFSRYSFLTLSEWGYRAVVSAVSDIIASGGRPLGILYSVGIRNRGEAFQIAEGIRDSAKSLGVIVLKSDLNRATTPWIDVAAIGYSPKPVSRRGAKPGDIIFQAGFLGYGLLEVQVARGSVPLEDARLIDGFAKRLPPLGVDTIISGYATASSDNSDGWYETLMNIGEASGVGFMIEEVHADPAILDLLSNYIDLNEMDLLGSWEDYNIAFTSSKEYAEEILAECNRRRIPCWVIGRVTEARGLWFKGEKVNEEYISRWRWL